MQSTTSIPKNETLSSTIRTFVPIRLRIGMRCTDIGEIAHPIRVGIESGLPQKERETQHIRHTGLRIQPGKMRDMGDEC